MIQAFRHLRLERPLAVLDLETTGSDPRAHRIVEIALLKFAPNAPTRRFHSLVHPGGPIPRAATQVHGLTDHDVADAPDFRALAPGLLGILSGCDLAGFNLRRFDLPFLDAAFTRAGFRFPRAGRAVIDALHIYHRHEPRDLTAAARHYLGQEHDHAHQALADAEATAAILDAQVGMDDALPTTPAKLHRALIDVDVAGRFRTEGGAIVFTSGKYLGRTLAEVARHDPGYLRGMMTQDCFDDGTD
jgi:DNA polymerase-3 subunit epsilon